MFGLKKLLEEIISQLNYHTETLVKVTKNISILDKNDQALLERIEKLEKEIKILRGEKHV